MSGVLMVIFGLILISDNFYAVGDFIYPCLGLS